MIWTEDDGTICKYEWNGITGGAYYEYVNGEWVKR